MLIKQANSSRVARDAIVLDLGDIAAQGEAIRRQSAAAAERIIREAHEERTRVLAGAREEGLAAGREAGMREGLAQGTAEGLAKASSEHSKNLAELSRRWEAALASFEAARVDLLADAKASLLALAVEVSERIVRKTIEHDPASVERQLEAALGMVLSQSRLRISVHPDAHALATQALPVLMKKLSLGNHAEVIPDPALEAGGCILRTDRGELDASIGTQLDELARVLLGRSPDGEATIEGKSP